MIPEFLRRENGVKIDNKLKNALDAYINQFGTGVNTEPSSLSDEEWIELLQECMERNISYEEMYGKIEDDDIDY